VSSVLRVISCIDALNTSEARVLLYDQLLLQIPRAFGHCFPCVEEEASPYVSETR